MSHSHGDHHHHEHSSSCSQEGDPSSSLSPPSTDEDSRTSSSHRTSETNGISNPLYPLPPSLQEEYTLSNEFFRAEQLYHHIEGNDNYAGSSSSSVASALFTCTNHSIPVHIQDALHAFLRCSDMIRRESLFSKDEIMEDIDTNNLRYLLIEYYIALLRTKQPFSSSTTDGKIGAPNGAPSSYSSSPSSNASNRLHHLTLAKTGFEIFIDQMFQYGIISENERNTSFGGWNSARGEETSSSSSSSLVSSSENDGRDYSTTTSSSVRNSSSSANSTLDQQRLMRGLAMGNELRSQKIERFKRNTANKKRLQELNATAIRQRQMEIVLRKKKQGKDTNNEEDTAPDGVTSNNGYAPEPDDDVVREIALLELAIAARTAADEILAINQEIPLLQHALQLNQGKDEHSQRKQYEQEQQYKSNTKTSSYNGVPVNDISVRPDRPGIEITRIDPTYTVVKETIKADIFKSGYRPPTMSMEEWGDIVMQRTREREGREAIQAQNRVATMEEIMDEGKEDNEALFDAATYRKRGFEDWADGVPKGSGNTKRI